MMGHRAETNGGENNSPLEKGVKLYPFCYHIHFYFSIPIKMGINRGISRLCSYILKIATLPLF